MTFFDDIGYVLDDYTDYEAVYETEMRRIQRYNKIDGE